MRLKRLELFGFKSFADRTVLDFADRSLTGIVGPNGCGKSNVVDAVRWSLGETRPTSMRGSGMTDVIFKGSASRPPLHMAEVTLVLDNEKNEIESRGAEIAITRRLYKDGEGEYLLDGERVRLKDVRDMLFDTGLGSRGYSVLEQGRIDAVLSANPQQRRGIFEEAAGISRYRQRRHEAELRLKRVEQDLSRAEDVMGELRTRVRSLKIQAGKAERFLVARSEWTTERRRWLAHRLFGLDVDLSEIGPVLEQLASELESMREERIAQEAEVDAREERRSEVVAELDRVSSEVGRLAGEVLALEERRRQLRMRVESWESTANEEAERATELEAEITGHREQLEIMNGEAVTLRESAATARENAERVDLEVERLGVEYQAVRAEVVAQNETVLGRLHERTASQNRVVHLEESLPAARQRVERADERLGEVDAVLATVQEDATRTRTHVGDARIALDAIDANRTLRASEQQAAIDTLTSLATERETLEVERAGHAARIESLRDRERQLEELGAGTRKVLEAIESGDGPVETSALRGIVADHLRIDTRLARALDAALGDRAHALLARDGHVARALVDWARERQLGQVSVVVSPGLGACPCPSPSDYALFARYGNGVEGRLCDLISCDDALRPLAKALLCDVVVVSDLDLALRLVGDNPRWRFVTPGGDLVDAAGLEGGHREVTQGVIGRRAEADDLERQMHRMDRSLAELSEQRDVALEARDVARAALERCEVEREAGRNALAEAEGALEVAEARIADQSAARQELVAERERVATDIAELEKGLEQGRIEREEAERAFQQDNQKLEELERGRKALEQRRDDLGHEQSRAQVERTRVTGELDALEQRLQSEGERVERDAVELERAKKRTADLRENANQGREEGERIDGQQSVLGTTKSEAEARLEDLRTQEREGAAHAQEARKAAEAVQQRLDEAGKRQHASELQHQKLGLFRDELLGRAKEELDLDASDLRFAFEPEDELSNAGAMGALEHKVADLRGQLDKLGPVNVDAVEELEEVGGRLDHLETQHADLVSSRKLLDETIERIDDETRRLFSETFHEVRENFQRIFRQLFGGGKADILLEEDKDLLDAGIEIMARPPGREMLSIGLLSGGQRTMTALALLFAVFEARPSPFCVLDEVDAALDDANIDRFLAMLEGFRGHTQFIVVTHNKGTMSSCDALFGVTMEVKGVSRYVAVELEEVETFIPEVTGSRRPESNGKASKDESGEPVVELRPAARPKVDDEVPGEVEDEVTAGSESE
tara:strand:- start:2802 stop:6566 length:3765 start_codon:yes stop_codon:yes gene_type:complete